MTAPINGLRRSAEPATGDWAHLHPDRLRIGQTGVFAGDWTSQPTDHGRMRIPVGYVGILVDTWNGWAVFRCTRAVADTIVTQHNLDRGHLYDQLSADGLAGEALDTAVDDAMAAMTWDGDDIVIDRRALSGDPAAIERISPDDNDKYIVCGWNWTWTAVHPADCDHIEGTLPAVGDEVSRRT